MRVRARLGMVASAVLIVALNGCAVTETRPARPLAGASIRDIMLHQVDPAADFVWEAVSTTLTRDGTDQHEPRTAEEWHAVLRQALILSEAPDLLVAPGRKVAHADQALDDADAPGNQTAAQMQQAIDGDRARFARLAAALQRAALQAADAARARDVTRLSQAGVAMDDACEACHKTYWYPGEAALLKP